MAIYTIKMLLNLQIRKIWILKIWIFLSSTLLSEVRLKNTATAPLGRRHRALCIAPGRGS